MKNEEREAQLFTTRDLCLAATLITLKFPMLGIDCFIEGKSGKTIGYFKFEDSEKINETKNSFTQGTLVVNPKIFYENIITLRTEVINTVNDPYSGTKK